MISYRVKVPDLILDLRISLLSQDRGSAELDKVKVDSCRVPWSHVILWVDDAWIAKKQNSNETDEVLT
jgi:hypothetical protein